MSIINVTDTNGALLSNAAFISALDDPEKGVTKTSAALTEFVRVVIREDAFCRKIIPPKPVTSTDLVQSLDTDNPMRIGEMDVVSTAYPVTFLEPAMEKYYTGKKFPIYYQKLVSEEFYKPIVEIQTYKTPIKTIVEQNYVKDLQAAEDSLFITMVDKIIDARLAGTNGTPKDPDAEYVTAGPFTPAILAEAMKRIVRKKIPKGPVLINDLDFMDLLKLSHDVVGSNVMENIIRDGFTYTTIMGYTFIRTIKHEIVKPGTFYVFTTPEYLGVFDVLEDVKAFIETKGPELRFYLWEFIGITIANINGVMRCKLTPPVAPAATTNP